MGKGRWKQRGWRQGEDFMKVKLLDYLTTCSTEISPFHNYLTPLSQSTNIDLHIDLILAIFY